MKKVMLIGLIALSACAGSASMGERAELSGSPEALRAMGEIMAGLVTEGKASPDTRGAYWQQRQLQEAELSNRAAGKKSLFGGLFKKDEVQK
jgi:alkylated DNA nucleotide flippase Atl1